MDIRRFGPGHRRAEGPPGTQSVEGAVIYRDERLVVSELAFGRYAMVAPHANPNAALFMVISGGGFVQVGSERARVNHGEAVVWPANEPHGAYTDGAEMRAIVVEFAAADGAIEAAARELAAPAPRGEGKLAEQPRSPKDYDSTQGEPW